MIALLETLDRWVDETPPEVQVARFGNKAFRTWHAKLEEVGLHDALVSAFRVPVYVRVCMRVHGT